MEVCYNCKSPDIEIRETGAWCNNCMEFVARTKLIMEIQSGEPNPPMRELPISVTFQLSSIIDKTDERQFVEHFEFVLRKMHQEGALNPLRDVFINGIEVEADETSLDDHYAKQAEFKYGNIVEEDAFSMDTYPELKRADFLAIGRKMMHDPVLNERIDECLYSELHKYTRMNMMKENRDDETEQD